MAREARIARGEWEARGEVVIFMFTITGIRRISDGYRIPRISLEAWRLMARVGSWMGMGIIRLRGLIECVRGMACELWIFFILMGFLGY